MLCIACGSAEKKLANSHVISRFIRMRLTGVLGEGGARTFSFKWIGRRDLPKQDLPKPKLMCIECDNRLGSLIEEKVIDLIMPKKLNSQSDWNTLPINAESISGLFDEPLYLGVYDHTLSQQFIVEKYALSVAWRALHAMAKDGREMSQRLLSSDRGKDINKAVVDYIFSDSMRLETHEAYFYYWPAETVRFISTKDDEIPFAWTEIGYKEELLGVSVIFGFWIIVWPLFKLGANQYEEKLAKLREISFVNWVGHVRQQLGAT